MPPGQGTRGHVQSSGSCPSHLNCSAQTRPSDSLKGTSPRTDTALPHSSSAQMTCALGSVKFPSDSGVQASPECSSTCPEQGPSPPTRRTNPKRKKSAVSVGDHGLAEPETTCNRQWWEGHGERTSQLESDLHFHEPVSEETSRRILGHFWNG